MQNKSRILYGIYLKKSLPWLLALWLPVTLLCLGYPYFSAEVSVGVKNGVISCFSMEDFTKYTFPFEVLLLFCLCYFLYQGMTAQEEHDFLGCLPVDRKEQYHCIVGVLFVFIILMLLSEQLLVHGFWHYYERTEDLKLSDYMGWTANILSRLFVLFFLAMFFLWLLNQILLPDWWGSLLVMTGIFLFFSSLLRVISMIPYLFGVRGNLPQYRFLNIWACLTDIYQKQDDPAGGKWYGGFYLEDTVWLYTRRNQILLFWCLAFLLLTVLFLFLGRRAFCYYGHLGKQKKWKRGRAVLAVLGMTLWMGVFLPASASIEMVMNRGYYYNSEDCALDIFGNPWLVLDYYGGSLHDTEGKPWYNQCICDMDDSKVRPVISCAIKFARERNLVYSYVETEGKAWAKRKFLWCMALGAALGLAGGIARWRKVLLQ